MSDIPFQISVDTSELTFSCAHFICHSKDQREKLHGHNFQLSIRLRGAVPVNVNDVQSVDINLVKMTGKNICSIFHEKFIYPEFSPHLHIQLTDSNNEVSITCSDQTHFMLPKGDCKILPLVDTSCQSLAQYCFVLFVRSITFTYLKSHQVTELEIGVCDQPNIVSLFRLALPENESTLVQQLPRTLRPQLSPAAVTGSNNIGNNKTTNSAIPPPRPPPGRPPAKNKTPPQSTTTSVPHASGNIKPPRGPPTNATTTRTPQSPNTSTSKSPSAPRGPPPNSPRGPPKGSQSLSMKSPNGPPPSKKNTNTPKPPSHPPTNKQTSSLSSLFEPQHLEPQNSEEFDSIQASLLEQTEALQHMLISQQLDFMIHCVEVEAEHTTIMQESLVATAEKDKVMIENEKWIQLSDELMRDKEHCTQWEIQLQEQDALLQAEHDEQTRQSFDLQNSQQELEHNQIELQSSIEEMHKQRAELNALRTELQAEKDDIELFKQGYRDDCEADMLEQLALERSSLEREFQEAHAKLEDERNVLSEELLIVETEKKNLKTLQQQFVCNGTYVLQLARTLQRCQDSITAQQTLLNQERKKLDFALRDLNHVKFESSSDLQAKQNLKKTSSSLTGLLSSIHAISPPPAMKQQQKDNSSNNYDQQKDVINIKDLHMSEEKSIDGSSFASSAVIDIRYDTPISEQSRPKDHTNVTSSVGNNRENNGSVGGSRKNGGGIFSAVSSYRTPKYSNA